MRFLAEIRERVRALLYWRREDRELEEEIAFHKEAMIEENIGRGMAPDEARRRAALTIGGVERVKEDVRDERGTRPLEDLARDVRFASRRLIRERSFSLPAITTIALGTGVSTAVFAMVHAILLKPLPYDEADRLVQLGHVAPGADLAVSGLSPGTFLHYRQHNATLESMAMYMEHAQTLTDAGPPEQVRVALVSSDLFRVLRTVPQLGRLPDAGNSEPGAAGGVFISHNLWTRRYGADPNIIGRPMEIDRQRYVITGVSQPGFDFPRPGTHLWQSGQMDELLVRFGSQAAVGGLYLNGVARLGDGVTTDQAERDIDRLVAALPDAYPDVTTSELEQMGLRSVVAPLKDVVVGDVRAALLLLSATAGFLLLITLANATNLSLLRAERQRREVALERALGATRARVIQRFMSESVLLAAIGGMFGFVLAHVAVTVQFGFAVEQIPRLGEVRVDAVVAGFAIVLTLLTGGVLATVSLSSVRRSDLTASSRVTAGSRVQAGRRVLVVGQVALALTLLIGSTLLTQSYRRLAKVDLGFTPDGALTFLLPLPPGPYDDHPASVRVHEELLGRLRAVPGVQSAETATTAAFPLTPVPDHYTDRVTIAGDPVADTASGLRALFSFATPGYFQAMGIPFVAGRTFAAATGAGPTEAVLSAALARDLFTGSDPIGRRIGSANTGGQDYLVVGVVGNVPSRTIRDGPSSVLYLPNQFGGEATAESNGPTVVLRNEQYIVRTSVPPLSLVPTIRQRIDDVDPKLLMTNVVTLEGIVSHSLARDRLTMLLLTIGATSALVLGLIGIYGVLAYAVRRRQSELGLRIALGASPNRIVGRVVRQGALLSLLGITIGLVSAFGLTRFISSLLYEVSPSNPVAFLGAAAMLFAIALIASYIPARRAGRIDPVETLRTD
jgi:predicted permease